MIALRSSLRSLLTAALLTLSALAAAPADAAVYYQTGNSCMPDTNLNTWDLGLYGHENQHLTNSAGLMCPVTHHPALAGTAITNYTVKYNDRNATSGETVNGYLVAITSSFVIYTSGSKCSCATTGGCTGASCTNTFSGSGTLSWTNPVSASATNVVQLFGGFSLPKRTSSTAQGSGIEHSSITY